MTGETLAGRSVLVVDDDENIVQSIRAYLQREGARVLTAGTGPDAIEAARRSHPDLVILDLMLPGLDGFEVCRQLRAAGEIPVIMLTARLAENDRVRGLDLGADDYVAKPFSLRELMARARSVLRRAAKPGDPPVIRFAELTMIPASRTVLVQDRRVALTPTEFALLRVFLDNPTRVYTRQELIERVYGWDFEGVDRTIDSHIMHLRKKIHSAAPGSGWIETVVGVGYSLTAHRDVV